MCAQVRAVVLCKPILAYTGLRQDAGLMLGDRRKGWPKIIPELTQRFINSNIRWVQMS